MYAIRLTMQVCGLPIDCSLPDEIATKIVINMDADDLVE